MKDIEHRLRALDRISPPDLWPRITGRDPGPAPSPAMKPRLLIVAVAASVTIGSLLLVLFTFSGRSDRAPAGDPAVGPTASPSPGPDRGGPPAEAFAPPTTQSEGRTVMRLSATDGSVIEISYPPGLVIEDASIQAFHAFGDGCASDITLAYGDGYAFTRGGRPLLVVEDAAGREAEIGRGRDGGFVALVRGGGWTAILHASSEDAAAACAGDLAVETDEAGWPVLTTGPGSALWPASEDGPGRPNVAFINIGGNTDRWLLLFPGACTPPEERPGQRVTIFEGRAVHRSPRFAAWCDPAGPQGVEVHVYSDGPRFIDRMLEGLEVRDVEVASDTL